MDLSLIYEKYARNTLFLVLRKEMMVGLTQPQKPASEVRIASAYKHMFKPYFLRCGTLTLTLALSNTHSPIG